MKRLTLLLALVLLPSQALAECAWVMWEKITLSSKDGSDSSLEPKLSFESLRECQERVERELNREGGDPGMKRYGNVLVVPSGDVTINLSFFCLPDTIDPREKEER